jgi:aspartate carbamoyltransferase catalytic subunit
MRLFLIATPELRIASEDLVELRRHGISYSFHASAEEVIDKLDCLYLTRLQKERFNGDLNCNYGINLELLTKAKPNLRILHPLPRLEELPVEIDDTPYAYYFQQAQNGVYVRQALLDIIFGG